MGGEFDNLAPAVQRFHRLASTHELHGEVDVGAPAAVLPRLLALCMGMPRTATTARSASCSKQAPTKNMDAPFPGPDDDLDAALQRWPRRGGTGPGAPDVHAAAGARGAADAPGPHDLPAHPVPALAHAARRRARPTSKAGSISISRPTCPSSAPSAATTASSSSTDGLRQRDVFVHRHFLGAPLHVEGAAEAALAPAIGPSVWRSSLRRWLKATCTSSRQQLRVDRRGLRAAAPCAPRRCPPAAAGRTPRAARAARSPSRSATAASPTGGRSPLVAGRATMRSTTSFCSMKCWSSTRADVRRAGGTGSASRCCTAGCRRRAAWPRRARARAARSRPAARRPRPPSSCGVLRAAARRGRGRARSPSAGRAARPAAASARPGPGRSRPAPRPARGSIARTMRVDDRAVGQEVLAEALARRCVSRSGPRHAHQAAARGIST